MERIVVGVDGSSGSRAAAWLAADLAAATGAELELIYVETIFSPVAAEEIELYRRWELEEQQRGANVLSSFSAACKQRCPRVRTRTLRGVPETELAQAAQGADLLVVGHRGRNAVARALLGSVADRAAQTAPCPVLIVREGTREAQPATPPEPRSTSAV